MLAKFYQNNILKKPSSILILLLICLCFFGYFSKNFRLDASSETLLIEGDPDLKYLNEINERYGAKEFLVLTYTPKGRMIEENSIKNLIKLKKEIQKLNWVHSVITLLDIPLLNSSDEPLIERLQNYSTLSSQGIDKERGFNEILNSPVFRNFVISEDGKTSGIIVYLKSKDKIKDFKSKKDEEIYKDKLKKQNHQNILEIRQVIKNFSSTSKIHLGGIPMIADDMMTFIKNDIIVFGLGVFLFIVATLWYVFRKLIWVIVPISSCFFSVIIMTGLLGLLGWKVTVISSNFIALMLILTMAMNIHISTRYLQLSKQFPKLNKFKIISLTTSKMFWPILYTALTTIFAFLSLVFSDIKPIIDKGYTWSMDTLRDIWNGEYNGKSFLPDWMTKPLDELIPELADDTTSWYQEKLGPKLLRLGQGIKDWFSSQEESARGMLKGLWEDTKEAYTTLDKLGKEYIDEPIIRGYNRAMNWLFGDDEEETTEPHTLGSPGYSQPDVKKPFGLRLMRPQPSYRGNPPTSPEDFDIDLGASASADKPSASIQLAAANMNLVEQSQILRDKPIFL